MHHSIIILQAHARSRGHGACRRYRNVHGRRSSSRGVQPIMSRNVSSCVSVWCASLRLPARHSLLSPTEGLLLRKWLESLGRLYQLVSSSMASGSLPQGLGLSAQTRCSHRQISLAATCRKLLYLLTRFAIFCESHSAEHHRITPINSGSASLIQSLALHILS